MYDAPVTRRYGTDPGSGIGRDAAAQGVLGSSQGDNEVVQIRLLVLEG